MADSRKVAKGRNDQRARNQTAVAKADDGTAAWRKIAKRFDPAVRKDVEDVAKAGGLSMDFLLRLEFACHQQLHMDMGLSDHPDRLHSAMLQSRKSMRAILEELGGGSDLNTRPVATPDGLGLKELKKAQTIDVGDDIL